ncbi:hypothetical protein BD626DRAFT_414891, partial [Schizophyllum amplum]
IDPSFVVDIAGSVEKYQIKGVIYFGNSHFIMRVWKGMEDVWTYDGMRHNGDFRYEGKSSKIRGLRRLGSKVAVAALYIKSVE